MSLNSRALAIDAFRARAEAGYGVGSKLRNRVMEMTGVMAETQAFPVIGVTDAEVRSSQADVTPANLSNKRPVARLTPRESFDYLDRQDSALTNVDLMRAYGFQHGMAVGRQYDADIVAALAAYDANAYSRDGLTAILSVDTDAGKFEAKDLAAAVGMLMAETDKSPSAADCTLAYPASSFAKMTEDMKLASQDYLSGQVTQTGMFGTLYGCTPIFIGDNARRTGKGKLDATHAYLFDRNAIGLAVGTTERMGVVEWVPQKRSWLIGAEANAGATRINNGGIVRIVLK